MIVSVFIGIIGMHVDEELPRQLNLAINVTEIKCKRLQKDLLNRKLRCKRLLKVKKVDKRSAKF